MTSTDKDIDFVLTCYKQKLSIKKYITLYSTGITYRLRFFYNVLETTGKLISTEMDFWRRSARISRKDKIRNTIIKQKKRKNECSKVSFSQY